MASKLIMNQKTFVNMKTINVKTKVNYVEHDRYGSPIYLGDNVVVLTNTIESDFPKKTSKSTILVGTVAGFISPEKILVKMEYINDSSDVFKVYCIKDADNLLVTIGFRNELFNMEYDGFPTKMINRDDFVFDDERVKD